MKYMRIALFVFLSFGAFAQKRELTLSESVLQQYRAFRPETLNGFSWVPNSDNYVYVSDNYQTMFTTSAKKNTPEVWFTIQDVNKALGAELYNFFGYSWKNNAEMYLTDGQKFYVFNTQTKKGSVIAELGEKAENGT